MQRNMIWTGIEYHSLENCVLTICEEGTEIHAGIIGIYNNLPYQLDYEVKTSKTWETTFFEIKARLHDKIEIMNFHSDGKGNWTASGQLIEKFSGCLDIDISLTPFTNTLAINRLQLAESEEKEIKVLYVDILGQQIKSVQQKYTRLSKTQYKFENIPNDFEAIITVDELGLVVEYPELFTRKFITESNY